MRLRVYMSVGAWSFTSPASEALKQTFQGELTGIQAKLGQAMQLPGLKLITPFYNTPANII